MSAEYGTGRSRSFEEGEDAYLRNNAEQRFRNLPVAALTMRYANLVSGSHESDARITLSPRTNSRGLLRIPDIGPGLHEGRNRRIDIGRHGGGSWIGASEQRLT